MERREIVMLCIIVVLVIVSALVAYQCSKAIGISNDRNDALNYNNAQSSQLGRLSQNTGLAAPDSIVDTGHPLSLTIAVTNLLNESARFTFSLIPLNTSDSARLNCLNQSPGATGTTQGFTCMITDQNTSPRSEFLLVAYANGIPYRNQTIYLFNAE